MMRMKRVLVVLNPVAGKGNGVRNLSGIVSVLQDGNCIPIVLVTKKHDDARQFAHRYGGCVDIVVCVGGDGTFSEILSGMIEGQHKSPVGYLPTGSTNDYARSLDLSHDILVAAHNITVGQPQMFDVGSFNGKPFSYVAAFGALAKVAYSTSQRLKNIFGHYAYFLKGAWDLLSLRAEHVAVKVDEEYIEGDFILGIVSNSTSIGGILHYKTSDVCMNDGQFEIMLIKPPDSAVALAKILYALAAHSSKQCHHIVFRRCKTLSVEFDRPVPWTLDGEYLPDCRTAEIRSIQKAIQIITPSKKDDLQ